eukprot:CAMPEP_0114401528 /NCGR_PEP_ID=MMETSP0102-20121206/17288_1 /TAXON_ID=38822 ORGANISM="Pteridomonas danica, Strain PT" /NCGR_SAMPLE_ID=MMETSP0102 /ASSEMBLY_ACC=CAM_ASM_000212 /LENGTH=90 /DNA_ID=CAMNT_0001564597 /DNA_START=12 /DNA_END=284 /DNA_ORIENTATION=+
MAPALATSFTALYRNLLRESKKIMDFNFRNYALRRTRDGFIAQKNASPTTIDQRYQEAVEALNLVKRQSIVSQLYHSPNPFVMDTVSHGK